MPMVMFTQHADLTCSCSIIAALGHGHEARAYSIYMNQGRAAWISNMEKQPEHAEYRHGHGPWT
jgi:hypothetical protein